MTNLRDQMAPLLKDFQNANGRGNLLSANITLMKIVDLLMTHIERQTVQLHMADFPPSILRKENLQDEQALHGEVDLNVDLSNTPAVVEEYTAGIADDVEESMDVEDEYSGPSLDETPSTIAEIEEVVVKAMAKRGRKPNALKGK